MSLDDLPSVKFSNPNFGPYEPYEEADIYMKNGDRHLGYVIGICDDSIIRMGSSLAEDNGRFIVRNLVSEPIYKKEVSIYIPRFKHNELMLVRVIHSLAELVRILAKNINIKFPAYHHGKRGKVS